MELYREYHEGNKKASVNRIRNPHNSYFDKWEVSMYVNESLIQKTLSNSAEDAKHLAEDFVKGHGAGGPTLLSENIVNG
jgi:hypothetical protein